MEKENTKAFRNYMENAVNRLCYDAMTDAVIDALAKAPDWNCHLLGH